MDKKMIGGSWLLGVIGCLLGLAMGLPLGCVRPKWASHVTGGVIGKGFEGIEYLDIATGLRTVLLPSYVQRYSTAEYDPRRQTLYFVDMHDTAVKAWPSSDQRPRELFRFPKEMGGMWGSSWWLQLSPDGENLLAYGYKVGTDMECLHVCDLNTGALIEHQPRVDPKKILTLPMFWVDANTVLASTISRERKELRPHHLATWHIDTGEVRETSYKDETDPFYFLAGRDKVLTVDQYSDNQVYRIVDLKTGEDRVYPLKPAEPFPSRWGSCGIDDQIVAEGGYVPPRTPFIPVPAECGTYLRNIPTGEYHRFSGHFLFKMKYLPSAPNWKAPAETRIQAFYREVIKEE